MFSKFVVDKLRYYVYQLIDPRNGETFYVGEGTGNRVFDVNIHDSTRETTVQVRASINAGRK